ncbi:LysO family transporter [uncultured Prevotella sp.]|uniref:LysO family transporter n=1 Tax=uncultured Prevotella sp. TaxID=159272 RepID=UPI002634BFF4|nr:LysO family transporter [uncultured Prevotella sp.]
MFTVILIMLSGIMVGRLLRSRRMTFLPRVVMFMIWVLLFLLGVEVGANPEIIKNLKLLGVEALVIAVAGTLGSVLLAWALWRYAERNGGR